MSFLPGKLDLSRSEIKHIQMQLRDVLNEKIRLHLPQGQKEEERSDAIEKQVSLEVEKFLTAAMEAASDSINVTDAASGTTLSDVINDAQKEYTEPFDVELNEKVRKLYQEWETETLNVIHLRRTAPKAVVDLYTKEESKVLQDINDRIKALAAQENTAPPEDLPQQLLAEESVQYKEALSMLKAAQDFVPRDRKQLEKLKRLMIYLEKQVP
ncbi:HER130Cp [Eremothecium sinecaudum]|uniref:HER130Cp n=1 Tax=Eremothecium sinecaudum TaxID=45286 RepID=A0A0X8HTY9_9SACH|nr:HER130Cp [Eremothecium sinecaudum]AMD21409.1 HER130Cp [Eremothecium sinecaudum]